MEMNTIQKLLNDRAEKRLDEEISNVMGSMRHRLLSYPSDVSNQYAVLDSTIPKVQVLKPSGDSTTRWSADTFARTFWYGGPFWENIKAVWLPIYIEEESKLFLKEMDELKARVYEVNQQLENFQTS